VGLLLFALNAPDRGDPKGGSRKGDGLLNQLARWFGA
jgi:hypothetical protein